MRIILAFNMKPWVGVVFSGVITLLLGLIILAHWPVSGLYILGLFLGIMIAPDIGRNLSSQEFLRQDNLRRQGEEPEKPRPVVLSGEQV